MCQRTEDDDEAFQAVQSATNKAISRKCMSCDENACVVVRIADPMCR